MEALQDRLSEEPITKIRLGVNLEEIIGSWVSIIVGKAGKCVGEKLFPWKIQKSVSLNPPKINKKLQNAASVGEVVVGNEVVPEIDLLYGRLQKTLVSLLGPDQLEKALRNAIQISIWGVEYINREIVEMVQVVVDLG